MHAGRVENDTVTRNSTLVKIILCERWVTQG
jgi:hypothetical protein